MVTLKAGVRSEGGKGVARKLRNEGRVPAVAYGHGVQDRSLVLDRHELELLLASINPDNTIIDLQVEGAPPVQTLIREVQRHPWRPQILHVDFFQVRAGEKLQVNIPIRFQGAPVGVHEESGVLHEVLRELSVECLPADIPSEIELDLTHLHLGESIHVKDVAVPGVTVLNDPELVVCSVTQPIAPEPEVEEEEPERAGESPEESDAEEADTE
ncbi:MAG: 50S ribosomal protein L25 [Gemmatimonadota bacterium]|jgi:large subunit ribosomal protein L25|nr:50S ribosomal protein L25 [Gemmatimonadota bacterium]